jgi:hypothetical protein
MKHLLIFLLAFPFLASAQILEKQFVATVQYNGFTQINDSLYRGDLIEFRDVLIEGYQPSGVDSGFICLDGTGRAYRVEVVNSFDYSGLDVDLIELDDYDEIPIGVGIVAERYGSTYQIPNGLVNSIGISAVLQAKILNHNTKIAATTVQPPDTLYLQELSGTTAISNGDTIPLIDYVRVVDTPAMLLNYPSTAGYGIIDGGKTWRADTTSPSGLATRKYASTLPTLLTANYAAISNGTNLIARNLFDNNTYVGILNSKPFLLGQWTTAGRPTGVDGYYGKNTTTGFLEGYYSSQWENLISSTGASSGQVSYFTGAGQIAGSNNHFWDNTNKQLSVISDNSSNASRGILTRQTNNGFQASLINFEKIRGSSAVQLGDIIGIFGFRGYSGTQYLTDNSLFGGLVTGSVTSGSVPTSLFFNTAGTGSNYNTEMLIHHTGNVGIGDFGSILSTITAPTYRLQVRGGDVLVDGENNNAERFIYAINQNNGTAVRNGVVSWVGGNSGSSTERLFTMQTYAPAYTGSAFGGSFVAGNFVLAGLNFNVGTATNQRLHFALGSTSVGTTDTIEYVFNRFSHTTATTLSTSTRVGAVSNRGFQIPGTTTAGRVLSKVNQYWLSYNIDSTQFNYRDNTGWHMVATRAYVRSLANAAANTNFANTDLTANGTRTHTMKNYATILSNSAGFYITSGGITPGSNVLSDVVFAHYQYYNLAKTRSFAKYQTTDTRAGIYTTNPNFIDLYEFNFSGSNLYEYGNRVELDTTNTVFIHTYGGKDYPGFITATGRRPSSGTIYRNNARFSWFGSVATENETTDTYHTIWHTGGDMLMGLKDGGKFLIAADSTLIFDPATDVLQLNKMGQGNKEATDLSKTQSNYIAGFATDGAVLDLERKRDTTIYVTDADYNFSSAVTSANILKRYNRILIYSKLSASASADNQIILHSASSDFLQCEIIIYSNDASADADVTSIDFTTNGAVDGAGGTVSSYGMSAGQRVNIRAVDDGGYKWFFN